jgi:hypothetical protein
VTSATLFLVDLLSMVVLFLNDKEKIESRRQYEDK